MRVFAFSHITTKIETHSQSIDLHSQQMRYKTETRSQFEMFETLACVDSLLVALPEIW